MSGPGVDIESVARLSGLFADGPSHSDALAALSEPGDRPIPECLSVLAGLYGLDLPDLDAAPGPGGP